ncbi:MAG: sugar-binding protein [Pseudomonadota bacterium]
MPSRTRSIAAGRRLACALSAAIAAASLVACIEEGPQVDVSFVKQNLLSAEPAAKLRINADLGGKVVYLGADVDKTSLKPGDKLTVVHYWKVVEPPGAEWRIFTHLKGATNEDWMNVDATKMRTNHDPGRWKAGEIIRDEQAVALRGNWASPFVVVQVGMYRKGGSGINDRMEVRSGPVDAQRAIIVARLPVEGASAARVVSPYVAVKASGPVVVDGKADEPAWSRATVSPAFQNAEGGQPVDGKTEARLLWDEKHLYVMVDVEDKDVFSSYSKNDDTLWKEDVVEVFVDANGDRRGYVELQVNPNNAQLDSWFAGTRQEGGDLSFASAFQSAVVVDGTKDKRDDVDKGWHVEMAIPWEAVKGKDSAMSVKLPPSSGDSWKLNIVRVEKGKNAPQIAASSWGRIGIADFHGLDRLVTVTFGDNPPPVGPVMPSAMIPRLAPQALDTIGQSQKPAAQALPTQAAQPALAPKAAQPSQPTEAKPGDAKSPEVSSKR